MTGRLAFFSPGLRRLAPELASLSGLAPRLSWFTASGAAAVGGWGHKPTAARARRIAGAAGLPYLAFEDGFLRSLKPGQSQLPASLVMDRTGIYYDAHQPSDLETLLETGQFAAAELTRAEALLAQIARYRLSKYNTGGEELEDLRLAPNQPLVLLVDQTFADESISGALADAHHFAQMAEAAVAENPGARVVARLHPETLAGAKKGYLATHARRLGLQVLTRRVTPWRLFELGPKVYTVSSQFGFEALLAGCEVHCFGLPFYAGWGLTRDRLAASRRTATRSRAELAAAAYLRYCRYFDCWRRMPVEPETAVDQLAFLRRNYLANARPVIGYRIARWKRRAVATMLEGPSGPPRFVSNLRAAIRHAKETGADIAAWGITAARLRPRLAAQSVGCIAIEDGFLRSAGLGAAFVQPLSLVFDRTGLHYDPARPSDIETLLAGAAFSEDELRRARDLRARIVSERLTKYNPAACGQAPIPPAAAELVLVPGQVADDWAVLLGRPAGFARTGNVNATLLERVRERNPQAFVIFKPHPDVESLGRAGALDDAQLTRLADQVVRGIPLDDLLPHAARLETYSSLAGFEALLRNKAVTVHGVPFYAGWGLTDDCAPAPRRGRARTLDELVAAALIRYPRYWDPASGLVCPPEVALDRLVEARMSGARETAAGVFVGRLVIAGRRLLHSMMRPGNVAD